MYDHPMKRLYSVQQIQTQKISPTFQKSKEMLLLATFLCLAAVLQQSSGEEPAESYNDLSTDKIDQQNLIVEKHNTLRREVDPPASNMLKMEWNTSAQANAKSWADACTLSHSPESSRTTDTVCGENLYMSTAPNTWSDAIQYWYDERKYFVHGSGPKSPGDVVGHYTQVVWYKSYQIGCAVAFCPQNKYKYYYVCHYCPAGNIASLLSTPYKSGPPCEDCPTACDNGLCTNPCKYTDVYSNCPELAKVYGCNNLLVKEKCLASCRCTTEIK
ncbi:serotriflin [Alligator mississippiensis]|uniref:Serotriflin n=2 Tax=Alligator mississippiensis TaxID=8496 RepID=A0A151NC49_ALLMI|nr:serotriflin [Alligator mississippiensis]